MREMLIGLWSTLLWRGVLSVLFGICAFAWPGDFMAVLATLFGIYLLVDGALSLWAVWRGTSGDGGRMVSIVVAGLSILIGLVALVAPDTIIKFLVLLIGVWTAYMGALQIAAAFFLRKDLRDEGWQAFTGAISIVLGLAIAWNWWYAMVSMAWLIGIAAIATGLILVVLGLKLRRVSKQIAFKAG